MINSKKMAFDEYIERSKTNAILQKMATMIAGYSSRNIKVVLKKKGDAVAFTNGNCITLNTGNSITALAPSNEKKVLSLVGLNAHESGHIRFTDFRLLKELMMGLQKGELICFPKTFIAPEDAKYAEELKELLKTSGKARRVFAQMVKNIQNIVEDEWMEGKVIEVYEGTAKDGIALNKTLLGRDSHSLKEMEEQDLHPVAIIHNILLSLVRNGVLDESVDKDDAYRIFLEEVEGKLNVAVSCDNPRTRLTIINQVLIHGFPLYGAFLEKKPPEEDIEDLLNQMSDALISDDCDIDDEILDALDELREELEQMEAEKQPFDLSKILEDNINESLKNDATIEVLKGLKARKDKLKVPDCHKGVTIRVDHYPNSYVERYSYRYADMKASTAKDIKRLAEKLAPLFVEEDEERDGLFLGTSISQRQLYSPEGRIMKKEGAINDTRTLAVSVLVDMSGSMDEVEELPDGTCVSRIEAARRTAFIINEVCSKLNIPCAVYGHEDTGYGNLPIWVFSTFEETDGRDAERIAAMDNNGWTRDGLAYRFVGDELKDRPEESKVLILISDGESYSPQPNEAAALTRNPYYQGEIAVSDIRSAQKDFKKRGINTFVCGIGEDKDVLKMSYGIENYIDVANLKKFPDQLVKLLEKFL